MNGRSPVEHRAVIALDISVLLRLARLDEGDANAAFGGPGQRHGADVLGAVIAANDLGGLPHLSAPPDQTKDDLSFPVNESANLIEIIFIEC